MSLQKFYSQFDDLTRKIDIKLRNETYQDLDLTSRNISDLKILLNSLQKTVKYIFIIFFLYRKA